MILTILVIHIFFLELPWQYECAAFQNDKDGTTVQYSLSRLMRTDANWEVICNTLKRLVDITVKDFSIFQQVAEMLYTSGKKRTI